MHRLCCRHHPPRVVTGANLHHDGSPTLDADLTAMAGMREFEQVPAVDVESGGRSVTYPVFDAAGSGVLRANGAAARLVQPGDHVIVPTYGLYDEGGAAAHRPLVVHVDDHNRVLEPAHA